MHHESRIISFSRHITPSTALTDALLVARLVWIDIPEHLNHCRLIIQIRFPARERRPDILRKLANNFMNRLFVYPPARSPPHRSLGLLRIGMFIGCGSDQMSALMNFFHNLRILLHFFSQQKTWRSPRSFSPAKKHLRIVGLRGPSSNVIATFLPIHPSPAPPQPLLVHAGIPCI